MNGLKFFSENLNDRELSDFYKELMVSEANHYTIFLGFARQFQNRSIVDEKWQALLDYEADFMKNRGGKAKIHG